MDNFHPFNSDPFNTHSFNDTNVPINNVNVVSDNDPMFILPSVPEAGAANNVNVVPDNDPMLMLPSVPQSGPSNGVIADTDDDEDGLGGILDYDLLVDQHLLEMLNEPIGDFNNQNYEPAAPSTSAVVPQENVFNSTNQIPESSGFGNPTQLPVWPTPPAPYNCSCCQVLREINHVNGKNVKHLQVHGRIGIVTHAVLDKFVYDEVSPENHEYMMYDFCNDSIEVVKNFLLHYFERCRLDGYQMLPDHMTSFYQAICVGLIENGGSDYSSSLQSSPMASGDLNLIQIDSESDEIRASKGKGVQTEAESRGKIPLAVQRERTGKLKMQDFSDFFHLPITLAAEKLQVCPTVIKKKCRQGGLNRWPYRKIKGIKRQIMLKKEELSRVTDEEHARLMEEIENLERKLAQIFGKHTD